MSLATPMLGSEVAGGVTPTLVCLFREPDAGNLPVRFDEREQETEPSQTGLRWRGESYVEYPPGDYSHCACSRLYSPISLIRDFGEQTGQAGETEMEGSRNPAASVVVLMRPAASSCSTAQDH